MIDDMQLRHLTRTVYYTCMPILSVLILFIMELFHIFHIFVIFCRPINKLTHVSWSWPCGNYIYDVTASCLTFSKHKLLSYVPSVWRVMTLAGEALLMMEQPGSILFPGFPRCSITITTVSLCHVIWLWE